jgi:hypothetical protein
MSRMSRIERREIEPARLPRAGAHVLAFGETRV